VPSSLNSNQGALAPPGNDEATIVSGRPVLVVGGALPAGIVEAGSGRAVIGGDNSAREFSPFARGIAHLVA
jgi:hypothetical protein